MYDDFYIETGVLKKNIHHTEVDYRRVSYYI